MLKLRYPQSKSNSQCGKIFALILSRFPERVPLYEIFPLAKQYGARIWTLRRWLWPQGLDISCEEEWVDGQCHSWYRLIASPTSAAPPLTPEPHETAAPAADSRDWYERATGKPRPSLDQENFFLFDRERR